MPSKFPKLFKIAENVDTCNVFQLPNVCHAKFHLCDSPLIVSLSQVKELAILMALFKISQIVEQRASGR